MVKLFGFNLRIFRKDTSHNELEKLQRYLTFLMPEALDDTANNYPIPGHIDWRYVQSEDEPVVKLQRCITECMQAAPKSKVALAELTSVINQYLEKPKNERGHRAEASFRSDISKIAPKIIQSWIDDLGFKPDKFWRRYLYYHINAKH